MASGGLPATFGVVVSGSVVFHFLSLIYCNLHNESGSGCRQRR
uniref:Uncharacterized protein n=1 Tax=Nelumbo nucifera TaxID=4432 RepID=A0A822ZUD7_NELNU|nr:TPA_asm: hypothetical protein HUJ06_018520 [Nelumbo nucifera]